MSRDIALVVDQSVRHEDIVSLIRKADPKDLESFGLFDVYQGKGIEKGKKSLAYNFVYRSAQQTLTDKKVNKAAPEAFGFPLQAAGCFPSRGIAALHQGGFGYPLYKGLP